MIPFETRTRLWESQLRMFDIIRHICKYIYVSRRLIRKRKGWWVRPWLTVEKRHNFGLYDQLMLELRYGDKNSFHNSRRMPTEMFDEQIRRLGPRLEKKTTKWRSALNPGLKLAICTRYLAAGSSYIDMLYGWRVLCFFFQKCDFREIVYLLESCTTTQKLIIRLNF